MPDTRHFDLGHDEVEPVTFTYKGVVYRCRGEAPALPVLKGIRAALRGEEDQEATDALVLEVVEAIFEDGELDRLLKTGITMDKLWEISRRWGAILRGEDAEGEAIPPTTGESEAPENSSSGSISSKPTSSASTASTSGETSEAA